MTTPTTLAVIPARGGSKGVPRKNIRPVGGQPLIAYTIETARALGDRFHAVVVSTDDAEIADVARRHGADVPFVRPADLARDSTPMIPVLQHAVEFVERRDGVRVDWVCLLQPTAPLRAPEDVDGALRAAWSDDACDSVISVVQVFAVHPILMKRIEDGWLRPFCVEEREGTRRQDYQPPAYMRNGAIYLTRRRVLMESASIWGGRIRPYVMPAERSVSIDDEIDMAVAEQMLARTATRAAR